MVRVPHLTAAEFEILKVLWRLDQATVAEVRGAQTRRGSAPAYTTVMTLLGRLAAKGAVQVDRSREPFVYRAAHRRESVIGSRVRAFLHDVFDGKADSLVLQLVEDEALSVEELRAIERMISGAEAREGREAPEAREAIARRAAPDDHGAPETAADGESAPAAAVASSARPSARRAPARAAAAVAPRRARRADGGKPR